MFKLSIIIMLSYLIGSIPTAVIISKKFFGFDIRKQGSGNMGSTNAFRVLGWKWGLTVQVIDILKGIAAVLGIGALMGDGITFGSQTMFEHITIVKFIAGLAAVCGHIWSIFVGFRGGKGINTTAGMLIGLFPVDIGIAFGIFALAVIFSGYISLGSIAGAIAFPFSMFFRYNILNDNIPEYGTLIYFALGLTSLLVFTHRANIKRLIKGTENRFSNLQLIKCRLRRSTN